MDQTGLTNQLPWAAVILSAGKSSRMKEPKALLRYDSRYSFIQKIVHEYKCAGCHKIIIVGNEYNFSQLSEQFDQTQALRPEIIINKNLEYERFYSIKLGLGPCRTYNSCFIQHCDNPFITSGILLKMIDLLMDGCYSVPVYKRQRGHPVLLSRLIMHELLSEEANDLNFRDFIQKFDVIEHITKDASVLCNINDQLDYQAFFNNNSLKYFTRQ